MALEMSMDEFLDHSGVGGGGAFLKNWKSNEGEGRGKIDIWLHPKATIVALWASRWYRLAVDQESKQEYGIPYRFNSMEPESVLKKQRFRNEDGKREFPPTLCPFSLLLEWVVEQIDTGRISWTDEIFVVPVKEEDEFVDNVIHAGGFTGLFGKKDIDDKEKTELRRAGIRRNEAYQESGIPRLQYVFRVVADQSPGDGCVVAIESQALGDKMKIAIRDRREDLGKEKGDPRINPVCFRWSYDDSQQFANKYSVKVMTSIQLSPEVREVLDQEPPSISQLVGPSNVAELRRSFEKWWVHKVTPPWDELFAPAMRELKGTEAAELPEDFGYGANGAPERRREKSASSAPAPRMDREAKPAVVPAPKSEPAPVTVSAEVSDDEMVACDVCEHPMLPTEFDCKKCGAKYGPDGKLLPKEDPVPSARRPRRQTAREAG